MQPKVYVNDPWKIVIQRIAPLQPLFQMEGVTEIAVNRFDDVWYKKSDWHKAEGIGWKSEEEIKALAKQIAHALFQEIVNDELDARFARSDDPDFPLPGGARVNLTLSPTAVRGACINIRLFPKATYTAADLLERGTYTEEQMQDLRTAVEAGENILVSGATGSGKTTLLNVLGSWIPEDQRVLIVEDTHELQIHKPNLVAFEAVTKQQLPGEPEPPGLAKRLESALRKCPDRILVGEIRTPEAANVFRQAMNTGHRGCLTTTHANSPEDALERIVDLAISAARGMPYGVLDKQIRRNVDLVIHMEKRKLKGLIRAS